MKRQIRIFGNIVAVINATVMDYSKRFVVNLLWPLVWFTHFGPRDLSMTYYAKKALVKHIGIKNRDLS